MPEILTRAGKGSDLTPTQADSNFKRTVNPQTGTYTTLSTDNRNLIECSHATVAFTVTLLAVATAAAVDTGDYEVTIFNIGAAIVSVDGNAADTINGGTASVTLRQWESLTFKLNNAGTGYNTISTSPSVNPVVSGHIRAGNTQLWDGDATTTTILITNVVAEDAWEQIGPTAATPTNIWDDMDVIPSNATILIADLETSVSPSGTGQASIGVFITSGDVSSPTVNNTRNQVQLHLVDPDADVGNYTMYTRILIPLGATNQDFKAYWSETGTDVATAKLLYRGFMTD